MSGPNKKGMSLEKKHNVTGWVFLIPATALICWMSFYPMIKAFIMSMQTGIGINLTFGGAANYLRILKDPTFKQCLFNTFFYLIIQVPVMLVLALALASMLNNKHLRFKGLFRTAIFLPCATSLVSYAMIFRSMFANDGFINTVLRGFGMNPIMWFANAWTARAVIIIALIWRWTGYNMVFYLSGLQNIEYSVYEAAKIDGASEWRLFFKIVIPMAMPGLATIGLFLTLGYWNDWFNAMMYIDSQNLIPLQYLLIKIESSIDWLASNKAMMGINGIQIAQNMPKETIKMAIVVISTLPIIFAYPFFQRYFVNGLTIGAVKE